MTFISLLNYRLTDFLHALGSLRLSQTLIGSSKASYWLPIRLTRYRARPAHSFIYVHVTIRAENLHLPQCDDLYQIVQIYDHSIQYPFAQIQANSFNKNSALQYTLVDQDSNENQFTIDQQTGFLRMLPVNPNSNRIKSDYILTIQAKEIPSKLATNCYVKVHWIRRRQLTPRFIHTPFYDITLPELNRQSGRLRQRLFQIIALLDHRVYDGKLEVRYRMVGFNQHFIINRQTGYIAAKQALKAYGTYEFKVSIVFQQDMKERCFPSNFSSAGNESNDH